jgi:hypothetical protein
MPNYGAPKKVEIILYDDDGTSRRVIAERQHRNTNVPQWSMRVVHPSGSNWPADFVGHEILDAASAALERKESTYYQSRARGHRPHPDLPDHNIPIDDAGNAMRANIRMNERDHRFGRR